MKSPAVSCVQSVLLFLGAVAITIVALMEPAKAQTRSAKPKAVIQTTAPGPQITLDAYLASVREKNDAVRSAFAGAEGGALTASDADLLTSPQLFGSGQSTSDEKPNPFFGAEKTLNQSYSLGIQQQTTFGLGAKLSYNLGHTELQGVDFPGVVTNYHEASPVLEVTQQLWRNGFGSETRAQIEAARSSAKAHSEAEAFRAQTLLLNAEINYWSLALARETVKVQQDALERAERLFDWAGRRSRLGLADRADFLQAQANLQARHLELLAAKDSERAAMRSFNSGRGLDLNIVEEQLQPLTQDVIDRMSIPAARGTRGDVKAAEFQKSAIAASARANREKSAPSVEVFGKYAFNGFDAERPEAIDQSWTNDRPTTTIGLRFQAPLDFSAASRSREGWAKEQSAAEYTYQRKVFEQERDWDDLSQKFGEAKERLKLYQELERTQRQKLDYERDRHTRGRTTTQQILLFELDFAQAAFGRIRTLAELLQLHAQLKLYGVSNESR